MTVFVKRKKTEPGVINDETVPHKADIINVETGNVSRQDIDPGTIILNYEIIDSVGTRKSTSAHEGTHGDPDDGRV